MRTSADAGPVTAVGDITPGKILFGAYEILGTIGSGGMGTVYRARHQSLGAPRAVKVIRSDQASEPEALAFFLREARALLEMQHDAIVRCHDLLCDDEGRVFLIMEYVDGPSLATRLADGPLAPDQVWALLGRIVSGLAAAHARGVVHRDIATENVLLPDGRPEHAKLIDFGLAKIIVEEESIVPGFKGRITFASPEQFGLFGGGVDFRSDFYSLGLVLAEACSGESVFDSASLLKVFEERRTLPRLSARIPGDLRAILEWLLAPDPLDRPASAVGLLDVLTRIGSRRERRALPTQITPLSRSDVSRTESGLIGREVELEGLEDAIDGVRPGRPSVLLVLGDPGIGKTSLANALLDRLRRRQTLAAYGRAYEPFDRPFQPFVECLTVLLRRGCVPAISPSLAGRLATLRTLAPELDPYLPPASSDLPVDPRALVRALAMVFQDWSATGTLVVVVDDLHLADESSLNLVRQLGRPWGGEGRLLVLCMARETELSLREATAQLTVDLEREGALVRFPLQALVRPAVEKLLERQGIVAPAAELLDFIFEKSQGNPYFALEVFRDLNERSLTDSRGTAVALSALDWEIPRRIQNVVRARLSRLSPACREVLSVAALVGTDASFELLTEAVGVGSAALTTLLEEAIGARVLTEIPEGNDSVRYRFAHTLVGEVLSRSFGLARRRQVHAAIATALDRICGTTSREHVHALAHHCAEAGRWATPPLVIRYCRDAGDQSAKVGAFSDAARFYEAVLASFNRTNGSDPSEIANVKMALATAVGRLGDVGRARSLCDEALLALGGGEPGVRARLAIASILRDHAACEDALVYVGDALADPAAQSPALRGELLVLYAQLLDNTGRGDQVRSIAEELLPLTNRPESAQLQEQAFDALRIWHMNHTADFAVASSIAARQIETSRGASDRADLARRIDEHAFYAFLQTRVTEALTQGDDALDLAGKAGEPSLLLNVRALRAICFAFRGEWDRVDEEWTFAESLLTKVPGSLRLGLLVWARVRSDLWRGRVTLDLPQPGAMYEGMALAARSVLAVSAYVASERREPGADEFLRAVAARHPRGGAGLNWLIVSQALACGFANLGRGADAAEWYEPLITYGDTLYVTLSSLARARIACLQGWTTKCAQDLAMAEETCRREKLRPLLLIALVGRAGLWEQGCRPPGAQASPVLEEAAALRRDLHMSEVVS